jgi:hypothetical protein
MPGNELSMLARLQEFERAFRQKYGREMTAEELSSLQAAREILERRLRETISEKGAA